MKSYLLISILFFLATLIVNASEEIIVPVKEIVLTSDAVPCFGIVTLRVNTMTVKDKIKFKEISIKIKNVWKKVPPKAFADLEQPLLSTLQLRAETDLEAKRWLYIYFELPPKEKNLEPRQVHISYQDEDFVNRSITIPRKDGGSNFKMIDLK